jgi:hypothetical protein
MHRYTCFGAYILNHDKLIINHYALSSSVTVRILSRAHHGMRTHLYLIMLESPLIAKSVLRLCKKCAYYVLSKAEKLY